MLYIVSTPIGNLKDITLRAIEVLDSVDVIFAEDTRRTGVLLKHLGIKRPMESYNDINKVTKTDRALDLLREDKSIALVSDSGTPCISDPGFYLVRAAAAEGLSIVPVPGASSVLAALCCSGLPTDRFTFYGFFPKKKGKAEFLVKGISKREETAVFLESPNRIEKTLYLLANLIPSRQVVIGRELTKLHEEFLRGTPEILLGRIKKKALKGELVLMFGK